MAPRRQVRVGVPVRVGVAGVGRRVDRPRSLLGGRPPSGLAVSATGDLNHQGEECEEEAQTHAADEEECCSLRVVCFSGTHTEQGSMCNNAKGLYVGGRTSEAPYGGKGKLIDIVRLQIKTTKAFVVAAWLHLSV